MNLLNSDRIKDQSKFSMLFSKIMRLAGRVDHSFSWVRPKNRPGSGLQASPRWSPGMSGLKKIKNTLQDVEQPNPGHLTD